MLKQRVITASILALLALWAVLKLPVAGFGGLLLGITLLCAWEWAALAELTTHRRWIYCGLMGLLIVSLWPVTAHAGLAAALLIPIFIAWCGATFWLLRSDRPPPVISSAMAAAAGLAALSAAWLALMGLRQAAGPGLVLFLLALIWAADTGAYFAGRRWGQRKLAPRISPGKTWEGVGGAAVAVLAFGLIGVGWLEPGPRWPGFLALCLVTAGCSIAGDLFESLLKRQRGLKDSGALLPGHGGILDRLDSLIAAAPVFFLGWQGLSR